MSKSTLYDIANEFEKSLDNLLDHDDSDLIKEIESIEGEFKSKSANVAKYIRNLEHLAQGIKEIERSQRDRRNSLEKKIARLKDYLRINFEKTNTEKIESDDIVIAIYKNPAKVHIVDEEKIPEEFFQIKETKLLNKDKIKESLKNTGIRQIIANRMYQSAQNPQVTLNTVASVDNLNKLQKKLISDWRKDRIRPQINDLLVKIVSETLAAHPKLNAHYIDDTLNIIENINLGVAMAVKDGLVVPVIVDSQNKDYLDISKEIRAFSKKIKENQLLPDEITGSTFTISNLSSYNVEYFNPIINPPEVSILGLGKISKRIDLDENGEIKVKNVIHLSLTFDHRALDGVPASNFLDDLVKNIESI